MTLRPAPGAQLAAGRLRVDATKAIAKLREYQLVDRTAWILEAIRAAVAADATAIDLQGDANDVWLSWAGTPWPAEDLPRLFDELVSPEPGAARHHVRLLAAAVNSALGAHPAYVDVYAVGERGAVRARYTPDVLEAPATDLEASPLARVAAVAVPSPPGVPVGMHVHFRRRTSLEVVSYWLRRADPPELVLARAACTDITTPIRIGDATYERATNPRDVIRLPLGEDLDGWIAVTDASQPVSDVVADLALAERGVLLERAGIALGLPVLHPAPLRVVIDAPRLPTNASRSEVRRDTHPVSTGIRRAKERVPELLAALAARSGPPHSDPRARSAAIHLLAAAIGGDGWAARARDIEPPLRALAELPLVRDAVGVPRPVCWSWSGLVYAGKHPLPDDLAPWLAHVLWAPPGDATAAIPRYWIDDGALARHLRTAKRARRAARKFFQHAPREARVLGRRVPRVRVKLGAPFAESCIPDAMFEGISGEVCVYRERRGSELTILLEGRVLETVELDSALPFEAVIDCDRVKPADQFRGALRDDGYAHVLRAMRAGVVRALEAVALAHRQQFVDAHHVATDGTLDDDASLIRSALYLARELVTELSAPFETARIWRTTEGARSLAELRAQRVLGVVPVLTRVPALPDRLVVHADAHDRALLAALVPAVWIAYDPGQLAGRVLASELATELLQTEPHALGIEDGELVVAIAPAAAPRLVLHHRGRALAPCAYQPTLAPCTIAIDADAIVPTADWRRVADDAGLAVRDHGAYERMLARETVRALLGERSPALVGDDRVELASSLGHWLCLSLELAPPADILGEELRRRLELASLFRILGDERRHSLAELAVMFPETIVFVEQPAEPVADFPVVLAPPVVARMIARVANRALRDGRAELAERRAQLVRELRLGMHRAKPVVPLEVAGASVTISQRFGHGVVGCGSDTLEIQVLVEGRLFQTITRRQELPLSCVFALTSLAHVDAQFEAVLPEAADLLVSHVRARSAELVRAIAEQDPEAFAQPGPRRSLLAAYAQRFPLATELREALVRTIELPTVQGGRAKILEARRGATIATSTWVGDWLPPDGEPDAFDAPILRTAGSPELGLIISALGNATDVTSDVARVQTQRRIARGLLPAPRCIGVAPELTRQIGELATTFRHLGPGEVALVAGEAEVLLHAGGELRERVAIDCVPAIQLAIEAADLVGDRSAVDKRIAADAQQLALLLAQRVLAQQVVDERGPRTLPPDIRRNLCRAILAGHLPQHHDAPVFETITGRWVDLATVLAQRDLFGDLWCVAEPPAPDTTPLDERRIVLVLSARDRKLASEHGIPAIGAEHELALDMRTRRNLARPSARSLALEAPGILATIEIAGDGITAPRGVVGILASDAAHHRALQLHRALHPFNRAPDPCRWPTVANLDDARLAPDRCWEHPERDDIYKATIDVLHRASNDALRTLAPPPAGALASIRVAPWTYDATLLRTGEPQLRGTLWIEGPPIPAIVPTIRIVDASGESAFVPLRGLGLGGVIFVHATRSWEREPILEALCRALHVKLVKELALAHHARASDVVAAQVAWALALERITPEDAGAVRFACFTPSPLDARALATLLHGTEPVTIAAPGHASPDLALVDDGSETARVIRTWLGDRVRPPAPARRRPDTVEPPPPANHPLQPFLERLHRRIARLGVQVPRWRFVEGREAPIVRYADATLELATANRHVVDTAAACAASSAWSADALDALAAHCITVLNVALTEITDASEAAAIGKLLAAPDA